MAPAAYVAEDGLVGHQWEERPLVCFYLQLTVFLWVESDAQNKSQVVTCCCFMKFNLIAESETIPWLLRTISCSL